MIKDENENCIREGRLNNMIEFKNVKSNVLDVERISCLRVWDTSSIYCRLNCVNQIEAPLLRTRHNAGKQRIGVCRPLSHEYKR
jgi:hypothetical protein